ncbi:MAG: NUDIX pyrophosphatase [Gammaproteobacteria bacterium]|nr:NUDIX pyrophosphatase [Gammaproteobacteria bacterium]
MGYMEKREVVTAFLRYENRILLLKRSDKVETYPGFWSGVSGYLGEDAMNQARQEISEETGLADEQLSFVCGGEPLDVPAPELDTCWQVHPFLFDIADPDLVTLNWESETFRWVKAEDIHGMETVPLLLKTLARCLERERGRRH